MRLNRRQLRRLIESAIYEQQQGAANIDFKDKKEIVAAAAALHSAMFGGIIGLGTDEEAIREIFASLEGNEERLDAIKDNYSRIFQRDLIDDLRSEMSNQELIKFVESEFPGVL